MRDIEIRINDKPRFCSYCKIWKAKAKAKAKAEAKEWNSISDIEFILLFVTSIGNSCIIHSIALRW